jgi:hypothetical protein
MAMSYDDLDELVAFATGLLAALLRGALFGLAAGLLASAILYVWRHWPW